MAEIILKPADMEIDKPTIERILKVVPEEDLKGLKEIVITYPERAFAPSSYDQRHSRVVVLIAFEVKSSEDLARVLFHEIAHHVQYKSPYWREMWGEIGRQNVDRNYASPNPEADISKFEGFARSYADEKLEKLRQTDPETLNAEKKLLCTRGLG